LAAGQALEAVRQELWNQPRVEPWQLERRAAACEPERGLPAVRDVRQSAVPVWEKAEEQRLPASELREGLKQELWQVVQVLEQQEP
jgi:hypothetical protein